MRGGLRTKALGVTAVAVLATALGATQSSATARAEPATVDRTFLCAPRAFGGKLDLDAEVKPAHVDKHGRRFAPLIDVRTGGSLPELGLVFVRARFQPRAWGLSIPWPLQGRPGVYANTQRCASARASLPLSPRGLPGPPIRWGKRVDCAVSGKVLVRMRADLAQAAPWRRADRWYSGARTTVREAKVAVGAQGSAKPFAYMEIARSGAVRLWYAPSCG